MNSFLLDDNSPIFYKKNKFKLHKDMSFENSTIVFSDDLVNSKDIDLLEILKYKIHQFFITLYTECPNFDPDIFLKNYKKTMFKLSDSLNSLRPNILGQVTISNVNNLYLKTFDVVNHELLHLSSIKKDVYNLDFFPYEEAYTRLLAERYFKEINNHIFDIDVLIIKNIETILGKNYMEKKYFKGKLFSTINELYKYESETNIKRLLHLLKIIYNLEREKDSQAKIQTNLDEVLIILTSCLNNKLTTVKHIDEFNEIINSGNWYGVYKSKSNNLECEFRLLNKDVMKSILEGLKFEEQKKLSNR